MQRETMEQILGTPDHAWHQACLSTSLSSLGVRQSHDQYKVAYMRSLLALGDLVIKTIGNTHKEESNFEAKHKNLIVLGCR